MCSAERKYVCPNDEKKHIYICKHGEINYITWKIFFVILLNLYAMIVILSTELKINSIGLFIHRFCVIKKKIDFLLCCAVYTSDYQLK